MLRAIGLLFLLTACTGVQMNNSNNSHTLWHSITPSEAKRMMDELDNYVLLDVRGPAEYEQMHIEGAILIPAGELSERAEAELPDKDAVILIYCHGGLRSEPAAAELIRQGYTNVYSFGGIISWPYGTVSGL